MAESTTSKEPRKGLKEPRGNSASRLRKATEEPDWDLWLKRARRHIVGYVNPFASNWDVDDAASIAVTRALMAYRKSGYEPTKAYIYMASKHAYMDVRKKKREATFSDLTSDSEKDTRLTNFEDQVADDPEPTDSVSDQLREARKFAQQYIPNPDYARMLAAWAVGLVPYEQVRRIVHVIRKDPRYKVGRVM